MFTDYTSMLTMAGTGMPNFTAVGLSGELANVNSMYQMLGAGLGSATPTDTKGAGNTQTTSNYNNYVDYLNGNTGTSTTNNATPGNATAAAGTANGNATLDSSNLVANYLKSYFPGMSDEQIAGINAYYDQFYGQLEQQFANYASSMGMSATDAANGTGAYGVYTSQYAKSPGVDGLMADAESMVGLDEHHNAAEINKITKQTGIDCSTTPWCAAWAMNMLKNHGVLDISGCSNPNYCPTVKEWAQKQGIYRTQGSGYTPQAGDAILFDFGKGRASHIGIVQKVENGKVYTIEGNASNGVRKRTYDLSSGSIIGYVDCAAQKK